MATTDVTETDTPTNDTPTAGTAVLSIGEVSERTGLSVHTLRFYEQEGLFFAPVRRNGAGRRLYSEADVEWLLVCSKLRSSGMPLPSIRRYAELARVGESTVEERLGILRQHESAVRAQLAELQDALGVIERKVALYTDRLAAGTADSLWRNGPECDS
jgi:DNA-binding transcriptional MerR regulator